MKKGRKPLPTNQEQTELKLPPAPFNCVLIDEYVDLRQLGLAGNSASAYRRDLMDFARHLGPKSLLDVTDKDIVGWFTTMIRDDTNPNDTRPWSMRTAHRKRSALSKFYAWARKKKGVTINPAEDVELSRYYRPPPVVIARPDLSKLFRYLENKITIVDPRRYPLYVLDLAVFRLMDHLLLRVSEASHLRMARVTTVDGELQVTITKKGKKTRPYPLVGAVRDAYERWLRVRRMVTPYAGHEDYVFIHPYTGYRISRQRAWHRLQKLGAEAGLPPEVVDAFSPHKLRHSRARDMLDHGSTLADVQAACDHESLSTTTVYLEPEERRRLDTLRRLSNQR